MNKKVDNPLKTKDQSLAPPEILLNKRDKDKLIEDSEYLQIQGHETLRKSFQSIQKKKKNDSKDNN